IEYGRRAVDLDASFFPTHFYLGLAYQQKGQFAEAERELEQARNLSNNSTLMTANLGGVFAFCGKQDEARQILSELEQTGHAKYVPQCFVAAIHVGLHDNDRAFSCLNKACEERSTQLLHCLLADARFDALRTDARFNT